MKIAFLCSSFTPGHDGVGDYARRLTGELIRYGHEARVMALADKNVPEGTRAEEHIDAGTPLQCLRLSNQSRWEARVEAARRTVQEFDPEWVSLQFVCYGFHPRGWIGSLGRRIRQICGGRKLHLMFHELWIGESIGAPLKYRIEGVLQRHLILRMVRKLAPAVIHTHTPVYRAILGREGIKANLLPLFGNIPVTEPDGGNWLFRELRERSLEITPQNRGEYWLFGFFGALHPEWSPEPLFSVLREAGKARRKTPCFVSIGRLGRAGEQRWSVMKTAYPEFSFAGVGPQSSVNVSRILQAMDFGIATSPVQLLSKSGSAVAMLEHGLPVIVNRNDVCPQVSVTPEDHNPQLIRMEPDFASRLANLKTVMPKSKLPEVTDTLLRALWHPAKLSHF